MGERASLPCLPACLPVSCSCHFSLQPAAWRPPLLTTLLLPYASLPRHLLQTNVSVCSSLGHPFVSQFNLIFLDTLAVYK